jgi:ferrochelatase
MQGEVMDALVVVAFGGPEGPDEVIPFLQRVTAGRDVPLARLEKVAEQYLLFGGISPINAQTRALVSALEPLVDVPVVMANRHAPPFLVDVLAEWHGRDLLAFATSAYAGVSSCRAYRDAIDAACAEIGPTAPTVEKLPPFHDRAGFVDPFADGLAAALAELADDDAVVAFTAHSVPLAQAAASDYEPQLRETAALVAARGAPGRRWDLVFQSRSGPPAQPWLEPDVNDHLTALAAEGVRSVVLCPIGFTSDHMEVVYDLDTQAAATANGLGLAVRRSPTPGTDPRFVAMIADMANARVRGLAPPTLCRPGCCRVAVSERPPPPPSAS